MTTTSSTRDGAICVRQPSLNRGATIRCRVQLPGGEGESDHDGQPAAARRRENRRLTIRRLSLPLLAALIAAGTAGCRRQEVAAAKAPPQMIWRALGSWSGHG